MVWFVRSMLPLALLSPTGISPYMISAGMRLPALCLTSMIFGFLVALLCSTTLCVTMTRANAKYHVGKECFRQWVIASWDGDWCPILTHEHLVWRTSTRRQDSTHGVGSLWPWHVRTVGTSFVTVSASVRAVKLLTRSAIQAHVPSLASCTSAAPAVSCSNPVHTLTPQVPDVFPDLSALSRYTPPARPSSIRSPEYSLSIVPPVLRNEMMLPLLHT